jgi:hypothetical protein
MKIITLALSSVVFCSVPHQPETRVFSAAVTDIPVTADMSHADPKTWHALPAAPSALPEELVVIKFSSRTRPF